MDVSLTETQSLLRDSIRDYLRNELPLDRARSVAAANGYDKELWSYLQSSGYLGLPFPSKDGGDGGELTDLAVLLNELTRRAASIPFMETMVAAITISRYGVADHPQTVATGVMEGTMTLSPAILEDADRFDAISAQVSRGTLTGSKRYVDYGQFVTHHLVAARENGDIGLYLVDADGPTVQVRPNRTIAPMPQADVTYDASPAVKVAGEDGFEFLMRLGRALSAVQCLGNAEEALDMSVSYVSTRVQFGRPIGTFQAVQHHCANMAIMVEAAWFLVYEAVWKLDRGLATDKSLAVAKAWAGRTATEVPAQAHQLHGGIGITDEYGLHMFFRSGRERAVAWGSPEECLAIVADQIEEREQWL